MNKSYLTSLAKKKILKPRITTSKTGKLIIQTNSFIKLLITKLLIRISRYSVDLIVIRFIKSYFNSGLHLAILVTLPWKFHISCMRVQVSEARCPTFSMISKVFSKLSFQKNKVVILVICFKCKIVFLFYFI